jgi:hypothetical protein
MILAKEKRRVGVSLSVGVIAAVGVFLWQYRVSQREARTLQALIVDCNSKSNAPLIPSSPQEKYWAAGYALCDPEGLRSLEGLDGIQRDIVGKSVQMEQDKRFYTQASIVILAVCCVPLVWYFLIDSVARNQCCHFWKGPPTVNRGR